MESILFGTVKGGFTGAENKKGLLESAQGVGTELFVTNSKTLKELGWKEVYDITASKKEEDLSESPIQQLIKKEKCDVTNFALEEKETKPPSRFTDGSLIITMEKAGKYIENESRDILYRVIPSSFRSFATDSVNRQPLGEGIDFIVDKAKAICQLFGYYKLDVNKQIDFSASIGIAFYDMDGGTYEELYEAADRALYNCKHTQKGTYAFCRESDVRASSR